MRRRGAFPQTIIVQHQTVTGTDDRNNEIRGVTSTVDDLPASVTPIEDTEDIDDRERSTQVFDIEALPTWRGADVDIAAEDTILWDGLELELLGPAAVQTDHLGRRDHLKLTARRIIG